MLQLIKHLMEKKKKATTQNLNIEKLKFIEHKYS